MDDPIFVKIEPDWTQEEFTENEQSKLEDMLEIKVEPFQSIDVETEKDNFQIEAPHTSRKRKLKIVEQDNIQKVNDKNETPCTVDVVDDSTSSVSSNDQRKSYCTYKNTDPEILSPKKPRVQSKRKQTGEELSTLKSSGTVQVKKKQTKDDDCVLYGKHVANKLFFYDDRIRAIVQRKINNILLNTDIKICEQTLPLQHTSDN